MPDVASTALLYLAPSSSSIQCFILNVYGLMIVPYSQLTLCAKWVKWTSNVDYDRIYESRNSKTRNDFLFRYETFLLTLS